MYSLLEIYEFIANNDKDNLKDYYNKSYDTLKELNKRSNIISFFTIVIFALFSFSSYITKFSVLGFEINQAVINITSPLLLSFFILEWCLIARRRRELMKILKHIGFGLFKLPKVKEDFVFNHFSLHSRNIMPFSFMIEFINVDIKSKLHTILLLLLLLTIFVGIPIYISIALYDSFTLFKLTTPILICNLLGLYCLTQIILFYVNEIKTLKVINRADAEFISLLD